MFKIYVPIRPLCNYLGLDWSAQLQRMKRDEVLAEAMSSVVITPTQVTEKQRYNQRYTVVCLELEMLPGWLFGISTSRVRPDLQAKVKRYRIDRYEAVMKFLGDWRRSIDKHSHPSLFDEPTQE